MNRSTRAGTLSSVFCLLLVPAQLSAQSAALGNMPGNRAAFLSKVISTTALLAPKPGALIGQSGKGDVDISTFFAELGQFSGDSLASSPPTSARFDSASVGAWLTAQANSTSGEVSAWDERGYGEPTMARRDTFSSKEVVAENTRRLLRSLGARDEELVVEPRSLAASTVSADGVTEEDLVVARKVFCRREIGGIRVLGDKIVASFTVDGQLRKVLGRWTPINYAESRLASTITEHDLVDRALNKIVDLGVTPTSTLWLKIGTGFRTDEYAPGRYRLVLVGLIDVAHDNGKGQVGMVESYDFPI